jgi:hypothetical protein
MAIQGLQIVHAIPGRIRVKVGKVKGNMALAEELQRQLSRLSVVQDVVVSPLTGSIMATYDPRLLESLHSVDAVDPHLLVSLHELLALTEPLGIYPGDVDTAAIEDWCHAHSNRTHPSSPSTVSGQWKRSFAP